MIQLQGMLYLCVKVPNVRAYVNIKAEIEVNTLSVLCLNRIFKPEDYV